MAAGKGRNYRVTNVSPTWNLSKETSTHDIYAGMFLVLKSGTVVPMTASTEFNTVRFLATGDSPSGTSTLVPCVELGPLDVWRMPLNSASTFIMGSYFNVTVASGTTTHYLTPGTTDTVAWAVKGGTTENYAYVRFQWLTGTTLFRQD